MGIIKGKKLMLFLKQGNTYQSIGFCTNHTFSSSASTVDVSHKDLPDAAGAGKWAAEDIDTFSWSISTESFYANTAEGVTANELFALYTAGTELEVKFGITDNSATGVPTDGWVPTSGASMLSGKVVITSFDINAPVNDNATFSITMTGKGPVTIAA